MYVTICPSQSGASGTIWFQDYRRWFGMKGCVEIMASNILYAPPSNLEMGWFDQFKSRKPPNIVLSQVLTGFLRFIILSWSELHMIK